MNKRQRLADALETTVEYLMYGRGGPPLDRRGTNAADPTWFFSSLPPHGGRDFGNPAMYAFNPTIDTLVREGLQNVGDVALQGRAEASFKLIRLAGAELTDFLDAVDWGTLREHLEASTNNKQKLGTMLRASLDRLDREKALLLLRLDDRLTTGMIGEDWPEPEEATNFFAALVRDSLNSSKQSASAGGSFGLGKAVFTRVSQFATVLYNSNLAHPTRAGLQHNRLIGRTDLAYHSVGTGQFAGPGWYGLADDEHPGTARSSWSNTAILKRLHLLREADTGTSILVVGFFDPSADDRSNVNPRDIAASIEQAVVKWFWPAITSGRMAVSVETYEGREKTSSSLVDPRNIVPEFVELLQRGSEGHISEKLNDEGDVIKVPIALHVPRRRGRERDDRHPEVDHEALLFIRRSGPDAADLTKNRLAMFRGKEMVIESLDLSRLVRFSAPFQAALLCGEAAGSAQADKYAEEFLRTAEPPAHDRWESTPDLGELYARGGATAIRKMIDGAKDAIRTAVKAEFGGGEEGPRALSELFKIGKPARSATLAITDIRRVSRGSENLIQVTVRVPVRDARWMATPAVLCKMESGADLRIGVSNAEAVKSCTISRGQVQIPGRAREAIFVLSPEWAGGPIETAAMADALVKNAVLSIELRDVR